MSGQKYSQISASPLQKQYSRKSRFMIRSLKMQITPNQCSRLEITQLPPPGNNHISDIISILKNCKHKDRLQRRTNTKWKYKTEPNDYTFPLSMQSSLTCTKKVQEIRQKSLERLPNLNRRPTALQKFCHDSIRKRKSQQRINKKKVQIKMILCSQKNIEIFKQNTHD